MSLLKDLPSPKRDRSSALGRAGWYPYYAGYSTAFAQKVLDTFVKGANERVLDPWNGSGTTTAVTAGKGCEGFGFDLNPVMVIAARARLLNKREKPSLLPLAKIFVGISQEVNVSNDDPLLLWLHPESVNGIRVLEAAIQKSLSENINWTPMYINMRSAQFSDLTAFFYVAIFRTVRTLISGFQSSNPTWIKTAKTSKTRIKVTRKSIGEIFVEHVQSMQLAIDADLLEKDGKISIDVGQSQKISLPSNSIDFVLSSPPYCTRIDYAAATKPELAVLGMGMDSNEGFDLLRRDLLGTSTVPKTAPTIDAKWGDTCRTFLETVKSHKSKASSGYYLKSHCQYFDGAFKSLSEISRCLRPTGRACLVVQDSFYKEAHNDLPQIYVEMAENLGMALVAKRDFSLGRSLGQINSESRKYRREIQVKESVLLFNKK